MLNNVKQRFICVYRPPGYDLNQTYELIECLNFLCNVCYVITICDDFNFSIIYWSHDGDISSLGEHASAFANFDISIGSTQLIKDSTYNQNILDLLVVNDPLAIYEISVLPPFSSSDHCVLTWHTWFPLDLHDDAHDNFCHDFKHANCTNLAISLAI